MPLRAWTWVELGTGVPAVGWDLGTGWPPVPDFSRDLVSGVASTSASLQIPVRTCVHAGTHTLHPTQRRGATEQPGAMIYYHALPCLALHCGLALHSLALAWLNASVLKATEAARSLSDLKP